MTSFADGVANDDLALSRRDVVTYGTAAAIAAAVAPVGNALAAANAGTVSGTVYENRSGGQRRAPSDPGIAGVLVSNGREVVRTDAGGHYTLPVDDESIVFVIKPTGYAVPVDDEMLPRFYYIHQPAGSPQSLNLRYRGIEPTGPLPDSVDFALTKVDEPQKFDVVLFTDPQPESAVEVDFIRDDVVTALIGTKAAFGMTTGDIMFDDLSLYPRLNRIIGKIGLPWYNIGGNHDLNYEAPSAKYSRETFKRVFGPSYYAFEYGGALFLMLDNVNYFGGDAARPRGAGKFEGRIGERQLTFIANVLKEFPADKLVVTGMHIPLRNYLDGTDASINTADRADFLKLSAGRPNTLSLSGHTHTTEHHYFGADDGFAGPAPHHHHVLTAVSGSWWSGPYDHRGIAVADSRDGSPNGFHILSIDGQSYATRFQPANEPNARQMRIVLDSRIPSRRQGDLFRIPHGRAARLAAAAGERVCDRPHRQCLRRRSAHVGRVSHRRARAGENGARDAARSVRRGGFRPQRSDQEALGQGRPVVAHLVGAAAARPRSRHPLRRRARDRRIWPRASRPSGGGTDRGRGDGEGAVGLNSRLGHMSRDLDALECVTIPDSAVHR